MHQLIDPRLEHYCTIHSTQPSALCAELHDYTSQHVPDAQMVIGPLEASLLNFLIRSIGATRILEVGTFTGYSALAMAEALPDHGRVTTIDINAETTAIGASYWARSPHGKKIENLIGSARDLIPTLTGKFDFVFIDADKTNYVTYAQLALERLSKGGIIAVDNCLWDGKVADQTIEDADTIGIRQLNNWASTHSQLTTTLVPIRDGIMLIQPNGAPA